MAYSRFKQYIPTPYQLAVFSVIAIIAIALVFPVATQATTTPQTEQSLETTVETEKNETTTEETESEDENTNIQTSSSSGSEGSEGGSGDDSDPADGEDGDDGADGNDTSATSTQSSTTDVDDTGNTATSTQSSDDQPEDESASSTPETVVVSGDATAAGALFNESNTNSTHTDGTATSSATSTDATASSTPQTNGTSTDSGFSGTTFASSTNVAATENELDVNATSGSNTASGSATTTIVSGDAVATADVVNQTNTNIVNSRGFILFLRYLFGRGGPEDVDLRVFDFFTPQETHFSQMTCYSCGHTGSTTVSNTNRAEIQNNVTVSADTGGNNATSTNGPARIATGDAYAAANVVTLANTNIVDSNYLFITFNSFGDWAGDVVFPNKERFSRFLEHLSGASGNTSADLSVNNNNTASTSNSVSVGANTGGNTAEGDGVVVTGEGEAQASVINQSNTNIVNENAFTVVFRIHGDFDGDLFNAPDGVELVSNGDGLMHLVFTPSGTTSTGGGADSSLSVTNDNQAGIENNVSVSANTGGNSASGDSSTIVTGDAHAAANVTNIANTNVVGSNWMTAIINVFGDWSGSVSFGRPDLWVGAQADIAGSPEPGSDIRYHLTVANNGDATAHNTALEAAVNHPYIEFYNPETGSYEKNPSWDFGTLSAGDVIDKTYRARIISDIPYGDTSLTTIFTVAADESDENDEDNTEEITFRAHHDRPSRGGAGGHVDDGQSWTFDYLGEETTGEVKGVSRTAPPALIVTKEHTGPDTIYASTSVQYRVEIDNTYGGPLYGAVMYDTLVDADGNIIHEEMWRFGTILDREVISIDYTTEFGADIEPGIYTNYVQVLGYGGYASSTRGYEYDSMTASSTVRVIERLSEKTVTENRPDDDLSTISLNTDFLSLVLPNTVEAYVDGSGTVPPPSWFEQLWNSLNSQWLLLIILLAAFSAGITRLLPI